MSRIAALFVVAPVLGPAAASVDWTIVPGVRVGPITATTSEKDLIKLYGAKNISHQEIDLGEGVTASGTVLFAKNPEKRIKIVWRDQNSRSQTKSVFLSGAKSKWKTDDGVSLGMSLKTLEKMNGRPFVLAGFGWNYGGTARSSKGGKLHSLNIATLYVQLSPASKWQEDPDYQGMIGDVEFSSDHPTMAKINPAVHLIRVDIKQN